MSSEKRYPELKSPVELESEVLAFWKGESIFEEGLRLAEGRPEFVFYEGPPTANGTPHNGHVLTRVIKDLFPRYRSMRGYMVRRKAGWDTHGLPVEVEVEKTLGIHGKEAIQAYGMEPFAKRCIESVFTYTREWEELTDRIGFWVDTEDAYVTYHRHYVESVWWALSELFKKGLLYQGHKVVWWWPQGGTALSAGEVGMGYKTVDDPSVTVRFRVAPGQGFGDDASLLAWTTTPWTLPSNTAIGVNPALDYAVVRLGDETLILAHGQLEQVEGAEVQRVIKGADLVGLRYEPIYRFAEPQPIAGAPGADVWRVIGADYVTLDAGVGVVHIAPAFGEVDFAEAKKAGVGMLQLVGANGRFVEGTGFLEGLFCKDADKTIIHDLKERGVLFKRDTVRHEYPFCWRADNDPLIQYARPAWFIRTTALNAEALENNQAVNWLPGHIKDGRFGDFLRNNVDWALSRERFWGTPLNIWVCASCGEMHAPSSTQEIVERGGTGFVDDVDLHLQIHKPWIDRVTLPCGACGATMNRVPEVIDCWFDSGCMPFAQWGFPHQRQDEFKRAFPADFISEAVDQTRGWFYSLLMISTLIFDDETCARFGMESVGFPRPYKTCIVLGHVGDMDGKKESKSKGNYTSPDLVIKGEVWMAVQADEGVPRGAMGLKDAQVKSLNLGSKERMRASATDDGDALSLKVVAADVRAKDTVHLNPEDIAALGLGERVLLRAPFAPPGADAFRWLFYASNPPWSNTRLSLRAIRELQREFLIRLRNVHSFFTIYANIADFDPASTPRTPAAERGALDQWILHELTGLTQRVTERMDGFHLYEAARDLQSFVELLANWYVRRSRRRFWGEGPETGNALWTLYEVLTTFSRLIAPFVPFHAEAIYQSLESGADLRSIHHCAWPEADAGLLDEALAEDMALIRELASLGLSARKDVGVRVRQPLRALEVVLAEPGRAERLAPLLGLLEDELNVKAVRFSEDAERFVTFGVKPNYKALGQRLGKDMKHCAKALAGMAGGEVRARILGGGLRLELPSGEVTLGEDDVMVTVQPRENFQAAGSASAVVALHSDLDDDLLREGLAREIVSKVQGLRRDLGLDYTDRIRLAVGGDAAALQAAEAFRGYIAGETLVAVWGAPPASAGDAEVIEIDGVSAWIQVSRA